MKKIVSLLLTFTILVTMTIPVFADDTYSLDPCTSTCEVNAVIDSQYTMILPATINLKRMPNSGACYGNIVMGCVGRLTDNTVVTVNSDQAQLQLEDTDGNTIQLVNGGVQNLNTGTVINVLSAGDPGWTTEIPWKAEIIRINGGGGIVDTDHYGNFTTQKMAKALASKFGKEILTSDHTIDMDAESFDTDSTDSLKFQADSGDFSAYAGILNTVEFVTDNRASEINNYGLRDGVDYININAVEGYDTDGDLLLETANEMVENDEDYDYDNVDECLVKAFNFFSKPILCTIGGSGTSYEGTLTFNFQANTITP